ncbi:MAG: hypothetical protein R3E79_28765 [Caldilineaceae bacterium]
MEKIKVGVLGATGAVGQRFVQMLQGHPWFELTALCASERSEGKRYADACRWNLRGDMPHLRDWVLQPCTRRWTVRLSLAGCPPRSPVRLNRTLPPPATLSVAARATTAMSDVPLLIPEVNPEHMGD